MLKSYIEQIAVQLPQHVLTTPKTSCLPPAIFTWIMFSSLMYRVLALRTDHFKRMDWMKDRVAGVDTKKLLRVA